MTLVNQVSQTDPPHIARLMGSAFEQIRQAFAADDWNGLRQSHFRVIDAVPDGGISITELGVRVRMTKQGCGQFVAQLCGSGHLRTLPDPLDGRARIVRRTAKGTRLIRRVRSRIADLESSWAERVGVGNYATFRQVLLAVAEVPPS
ncbi:MAG: MarR family winged helix-turn-helix transcriptional regulator [Nostocoides sp.]